MNSIIDEIDSFLTLELSDSIRAYLLSMKDSLNSNYRKLENLYQDECENILASYTQSEIQKHIHDFEATKFYRQLLMEEAQWFLGRFNEWYVKLTLDS